MKERGFTLIELLGVIVILSLLMLFVFPKIVNYVKSSYDEVDELTEKIIFDATNLFLNEYKNMYPKDENSTYCIPLKDLVDTNYLKSPLKISGSDTDITELKSVEAKYSKSEKAYIYRLLDNSSCTILAVSHPDLYDSLLTPVIYDSSNLEWVVADTDWYNYVEKKWANAVILNSGIEKNVGDTLTNTDIKAMFVWIPRFEYKLLLDEYEINFITKGVTFASDGYIITPAFVIDSVGIPGFWLGKYKTTEVSEIETINGYLTSSSATARASNTAEMDAIIYLSNSMYGDASCVVESSTTGNKYGIYDMCPSSDELNDSSFRIVLIKE